VHPNGSPVVGVECEFDRPADVKEVEEALGQYVTKF
jgi:hypothetical protein